MTTTTQAQHTEAAYALRLHNQAKRWAQHATSAGMLPGIANAKAMESLEFSLRNGARNLCIPSKLVGTKAYQENIQALAGLATRPGAVQLVMRLEGAAVVVCYGSSLLGRIQAKHVAWLLPILPAVRLHLLQCTGGEADKPTRGVNVVFSFKCVGADARENEAVERDFEAYKQELWRELGYAD